MSSEFIGILLLGVGQLTGIVIAVWGFRDMDRNFKEAIRIERLIAGLVLQESTKVQELLRS